MVSEERCELAGPERLTAARYRPTYGIRAHVRYLDGSGAPVPVSSPGAEKGSSVRVRVALAGMSMISLR